MAVAVAVFCCYLFEVSQSVAVTLTKVNQAGHPIQTSGLVDPVHLQQLTEVKEDAVDFHQEAHRNVAQVLLSQQRCGQTH